MSLVIEGTYTALVTPFAKGKVDFTRFKANIEAQVAAGVTGIVPVGTTGESPTLSHDEHCKVIEVAVKAAKGRVQVIAGTGSNCTAEAVDYTRQAKKAGANAALMVNPYYNKPTQEGLYRHFMTVADAVDLPIVLYNIPGRTNITMTPATVARLFKHPNIVAIKEATGSLDMASEIAAACDIPILSGDDSLTLPLISIGAKGVISVASNIVPERIVALVSNALMGDFETARELHKRLFPLMKNLFIETNPVPVKFAMKQMGLDTGEVRLPLCEMTTDSQAALKKILKAQRIV